MVLPGSLFDSDECKDYLGRPVGETVAKLCAAVGLDPALCVLDGETWKARRLPHPFEAARQAKTPQPHRAFPSRQPRRRGDRPPG